MAPSCEQGSPYCRSVVRPVQYWVGVVAVGLPWLLLTVSHRAVVAVLLVVLAVFLVVVH